jgi:hypothetical protein
MGFSTEVLASSIFLVLCYLWSLYYFLRPGRPMVSRAGVRRATLLLARHHRLLDRRRPRISNHAA